MSETSDLTRRALLGVAVGGVVANSVSVASDGPLAKQPQPGTVERVYEGRSVRGQYDEALRKALQELRDHLGGPDMPEDFALATWRVIDVSGVSGGLADRHEMRVRIAATCNRDWPR
jgi:hypothetical protein